MHGPVPSYLSSSSNESQSVEGLVDDTRFPPHVQDATPRLPGDLGVWLIILLELLTFAILFVSFAFARTREVELFNASQATLNLNAGALNTVLLISGSWCVACAVSAVRRNATNTFYMFYLFLTGFHFLHVVVGMLALGYLWVKTRRGCYGSHDCHALETGAAFWHMVDLLWIVLFPLVYVMR